MAAQPQTYLTEEDYLQQEAQAEYRSEYFRGEVFMMAGGTPNHNRIKENASGEIHALLKKRKSCRSYSSDQRVYIPANGLYTYPDLVVVCGPNRYAEKDKNTLTNPTLIVEVLSESTAAYDRGTKFRLYRDLPSLQEYVLLNSLAIGAEVFRRTPDDHWLLADEAYALTGSLYLQSLEASLALADLYEGTDEVPEISVSSKS
ncbi:Uma2 family endonuclease [Rhabdobacter roseus]|uniref:Uma2 family endonuclease n=1 Tax=Rhabdobacter roseus TaxID=1655419 RepID=A0A840TZ83_9BACT|nr:Uma2 family endonuclease [Rhabdobacter roseus]MBB5284939.1 Uma2 family endonuclease [Rhabdobacter roseus]